MGPRPVANYETRTPRTDLLLDCGRTITVCGTVPEVVEHLKHKGCDADGELTATLIPYMDHEGRAVFVQAWSVNGVRRAI